MFKLVFRYVTLSKQMENIKSFAYLPKYSVPTQRNKRNFPCGKEVNPWVGLLN